MNKLKKEIESNHLLLRKHSQKVWSDYSKIKRSKVEEDNRMLLDHFLTEQEIKQTINFADLNVIEGDGYEGNKHPHHKNELYSSYNLVSLKHAKGAGEAFRFLVQTQYRVLKIISSYFNEPNLKIMMSQLAVRKKLVETDLSFGLTEALPMSHPFHIDEHIQDLEPRTHSAVLFLNDDFVGGKFIFQENDFAPKRTVSPKPGRLVAFKAMTNYHGVSHIYSGSRYVFIFWFSNLVRGKN